MSFLKVGRIGTSPSGKTNVYGVYNAANGDRLGSIRWYGAWRRYTAKFWPEVTFDAACLRELADELDRLNQERKKVAS